MTANTNKEETSKSNANKSGLISSILNSFLRGLFKFGNEKSAALLELTLEADLKNALEKKEFKLDYQPIIDAQNSKIYGAEALLRWHHPRFGLIGPIDLFSVAEAIGLASSIGEWVLEEACAKAVNWHHSPTAVLKLFINVSTSQLRAANFIEMLYGVLNSTKIEPTSLVLEVPQTASLEQQDTLMLEKISKTGVGLAIDDFGTSSSNWKLLKSFSIIKIDNAMIQMINHYQDDSAKVVSAIFAMAKSLGIKILAEGVETEEQYQFLKDKKCDFMQGFYFSKPLELPGLARLLINGA